MLVCELLNILQVFDRFPLVMSPSLLKALSVGFRFAIKGCPATVTMKVVGVPLADLNRYRSELSSNSQKMRDACHHLFIILKT